MPAQQMNELMALPWTAIAAQIADDANTAVNCRISDEWTLDKKKEYSILGIKVAYRVEMKLDVAEFTSSIASAPGYKTLTPSHLVAHAPLKGTWRAGVTSGFKTRLRAWVAGKELLDIQPRLTETLELFGIKLAGDAKLDVSEPDWPRLSAARLSVRLGIRLRGFLDQTWGPETLGIEFEPPDSYALRIPLDVPVSPTVSGLPGIGFRGHLVIIAEAQADIDVDLNPLDLDLGNLDPGHLRAKYRIIRLEYDGALKFTLLRKRVLGKRIVIEASIPFRFDPGLRLPTPGAMWDWLPDPTNIPRSWGEHPPAELQQIPTAPDDFDFLAPALEIEEAVLPQAAVGVAPSSILGPPPIHHAPDGLIYEIRTLCGDIDRPEYEGYHDAAIWTGHFLTAEAFRYKVTASTEALERVRFILGGIEKLFQVTDVPGLFARAALRGVSHYDTKPSMASKTWTAGSKCHPGEMEQYYDKKIEGERWYGFGRGKYPTSRDSYVGVMMGMGFAYTLVPDPQIQETIRRLVTDALRYLVIMHKWNVRTLEEPPSAEQQPQAPEYQKIKTSFIHQIHHQLALLRVGKTVNPEVFGALYEQFAPGADTVWLPIWGTAIDPISKYYKFNLTHATMAVLLFLEDDAGLRKHYKQAFSLLRRATAHHRNAHFNLVSAIIEKGNDSQEDALDKPSGFSCHLTVREETRALLREWLIRRCCIRGPRGLPTERPPDPRYLQRLVSADSPNPAVQYTMFGEHAPGAHLISKWALPVQKRPGNAMDFVWQRPPFSTDMCLCGGIPKVGAGKPEQEGPALDYLLPFWMAAYLNVVTA